MLRISISGIVLVALLAVAGVAHAGNPLCTTKKGYLFGITLQELKTALDMHSDGDTVALNKMLATKRVGVSRAGVQAYRVDWKLGFVKLRAKGHTTTIWMPSNGAVCN